MTSPVTRHPPVAGASGLYAFDKVDEKYRLAPDVTRRRMY